MSYIMSIMFDTDDPDTVREAKNVIETVLPYMVDNVEVWVDTRKVIRVDP